MCEKSVELKCNWEVAAGSNLNNILVISYSSGTSSFENEIPSSDDIVDVSRTILLNNENTDSKTCELNVKLPINLCVNSFNIITSGSKILEVFIGDEEEYYGTFHGKYFDDTEGIRVYRYDVEIKRSKTKKLLIKFLNSNKDLWIYGMMLNVFRNNDDENADIYFPHNTKNIDFNNVQSILSNSNYKLSDNAEKCKQFLENYMSTKNHKNEGPPNMKMLLSLMNSNLEQKHLLRNDEKQNNNEINLNNYKNNNNNNSNNDNNYVSNNRNNVDEMNLNFNTNLLNEFKKYVDDKFNILQSHIDERLNEIVNEQNEKFDKILNILQNKNEL